MEIKSIEIKPGYTRVSEILSQWDKFSYLNIDPIIFEKKTMIGTNVHAAILEDSLDYPVVLTDEEGGRYFQSYILFKRKENISFRKSELRLYDDDLMITGAIDAILDFPGSSGPCLIDWKTSAAKDDLFWEMQANFYLHLLKKNGYGDISDNCQFVKLNKLGDLPSIHHYRYSEVIIEACFAAIKTYHRMKPWIEKRKFITNDYIF